MGHPVLCCKQFTIQKNFCAYIDAFPRMIPTNLACKPRIYQMVRCCPNSIFKCAASFHLCPSPYAWNISTTRSQPSLCVTLSFHWGQFASGAIILDQFNCRILVTRVNITTSNNYTTLKRENSTGDKYLLFWRRIVKIWLRRWSLILVSQPSFRIMTLLQYQAKKIVHNSRPVGHLFPHFSTSIVSPSQYFFGGVHFLVFVLNPIPQEELHEVQEVQVSHSPLNRWTILKTHRVKVFVGNSLRLYIVPCTCNSLIVSFALFNCFWHSFWC